MPKDPRLRGFTTEKNRKWPELPNIQKHVIDHTFPRSRWPFSKVMFL